MDISLAANERLYDINDSLKLIQREGALAFGTDAYLLSAFLRPAPRAHALELGCGNGVISLLAAARGRFSHIHAAEIQAEMAKLTARNVRLNALEDRITVICADVRTFTPADLGGEVDVAFANPPYMRVESGAASPSTCSTVAGGVARSPPLSGSMMTTGIPFFSAASTPRLPAWLVSSR